MKDKVVLLYPSYDGPPLGPPLSLLSLASPLLEASFPVSILDGAVEPNMDEAVKRELSEALCVGISFLTGPMIRGAIALSRLVRSLRPEIPIIFGGWHSSLLPDETLRTGPADVVVRGQGETTLLEVALRLREGKTAEGVKGSSVKVSGAAIHNAHRPPENINKFPPPAFWLANFDSYERVTRVRKLPYASSLGCPYACNYCTDMVFYERKFNAYTASRVIAEVTDLVGRYRLTDVAFLDSNFPVNVKRALDIARGFVESKARFRWTFQASTDLLCRMSDDEVCLLGQSGVSHMGFGTESGSESVLALMNKEHQRIEDMFETARKCTVAGIRVTFNLILGYPGETERDRAETFRVMSDICRRYPNVSFSPNIFTPYPGIPIWPQLRTMGVKEPQSLEEWASVGLGSNHLPWLQGEDLRRLQRTLEYFLLNNKIRQTNPEKVRLPRVARRAFAAPLHWRLQHNRYAVPWELWVSRATKRLVTRRSLLTGEPLKTGFRKDADAGMPGNSSS
jgi:anaerobic magnesium-protoporphyrin IX monomethyl ester cyclase